MRILFLESDSGLQEMAELIFSVQVPIEFYCPKANCDLKELEVAAREFKPDISVMGWRHFQVPVLKCLKKFSKVWIFSGDAEDYIREQGGGGADHIFSKSDKGLDELRAELLREAKTLR